MKKIKFNLSMFFAVMSWHLLVSSIGEKEAYKLGKEIWNKK